MKQVWQFFLGLLLITAYTAKGQATQQSYIREFNWRMTIPAAFEKLPVDSEPWAEKVNRNTDTLATKDVAINPARIILLYGKDPANRITASVRMLHTPGRDEFLRLCREEEELMYMGFELQFPDVKIDTAHAIEKIGELPFRTYGIKFAIPGKGTMRLAMFSRLFGQKVLTVTILYTDQQKGAQLLAAWKQSTFQ